jgi:3-dehydroquinate dehydratase/shikimate dehydrogenase
MSKDTLLVVPLTRCRPPLAEQVDTAVRAGADAVELRVDLIRDEQAVEALLQRPHAIPFIVTVRRAEEGGGWEGGEARRIALLERLGWHLPGYVDVEYAAWGRSADVRSRIGAVCETDEGKHEGTVIRRREAEGAARRRKNALVLSHHDLDGTPAEIDEIFDRLEASPAGIVKAVFTARDALDSCRVLEQLHRRGGRRPMIVMAMGEAGLLTRVLARKFGGRLTFAALEHGAESAPGQPTISELRGIYRWEAQNRRTRVFGVIGWPVTYSLGPQLHNAAMAAERIDGVYVPLPVGPTYDDLAAFLNYATDHDWLDFTGLSVTIPHKEHVARWLDEQGYPISELARRCGAVNTLVRVPDGGWRGENTDAPGALRALESIRELAGDGIRGRVVDVLGAGGVARAVATVLVERGCRVIIHNRSEDRARSLAQQLRCEWKSWELRSFGTGQILINCTSVGMTPDIQSLPISTDRLRPETIVFDTVYNPPQTPLLRQARARGCRVISGTELFIGQAAEQYTLWHGRAAPLKALRRALHGAS